MQSTSLTCADGKTLNISEFKATQPAGTVIIASAFGIRQDFYHALAKVMAERGYNTICFDFRGTGENQKAADGEFPLQEWATQDLETIFHYALETKLPVHVIGHSIGGQIIGLAPSSTKLSSITLIAASAPYWKRWPRLADGLKILVNGGLILPLVSRFYSAFPAQKFGLGNMDLPSSAVRQWASWMGEPRYLFDPKFGLDTSAYTEISCPILSLGFSDDALAPMTNIDYLLKHFSSAECTTKKIDPKALDTKHIGHTGFFKAKFKKTLWNDVLQFIEQNNSSNQKQ